VNEYAANDASGLDRADKATCNLFVTLLEKEGRQSDLAAGLPATAGDAGLLDACFVGAAISVLALPEETRRIVGMDEPETVGRTVFTTAVPEMSGQRGHRDRSPGNRSARVTRPCTGGRCDYPTHFGTNRFHSPGAS